VSIVRGEGAAVFDAAGTRFVDGLASLWYCNAGHGRTEIVDAVAAQMRVLENYNLFDIFTNEPADVKRRIADNAIQDACPRTGTRHPELEHQVLRSRGGE
jgi:adenosylmethionine-8-amino-7-oxononanoate aminotransferase